MFNIKTILLILLQLSVCSKAQTNKFDWLLGEWIMKNSKSYTVESWERASSMSIEGSSTTKLVKNDSTVFSESLRILDMHGNIFYLAKVRQNKFPVPFIMTSQNKEEVIFENENHDFPQKIKYIKIGSDSMKVLISLLNDNNSIREFRYKKR